MSAYAHLFQPLAVGSVTLPNRVVMGSMHTNLEEVDNGFARLAAFYAERARNGVSLIVTGGIAPNEEGSIVAHAAKLTTQAECDQHKTVVEAVHQVGGRICMQILHAGRYAFSPKLVGPSPIQAPINRFVPRELSDGEVQNLVNDYVHCALLAQKAGYDGVEIMGSEGYLINQFLSRHTNQRTDQWGGSFENRCRLALEIVKAVREACGTDFLLMFRLSIIDLVEDGATQDEVVQLAQQIEQFGADMLDCGIGWHEARVPTIVTSVPRAAFIGAAKAVKLAVRIPLIATNRINMPEVAEAILRDGSADLVSLARPFLADSEWVLKSQEGRRDEINTCIACNQACLDHTFLGKVTSCLVNPLACHETELTFTQASVSKKVAVVGAGPAGLATAVTLAKRGHQVVIFERNAAVGGQFRYAKLIPGKEEFNETLRYFTKQIEILGIDLRLNTLASANELKEFDEVVVATGVQPRELSIEGIDHPKVISYPDAVLHPERVGETIAIIGAGGIGFDVAELLAEPELAKPLAEDVEQWCREWGVDLSVASAGGLTKAEPLRSERNITVLQRKTSKPGAGLGATSGWVHRASLKARGVSFLTGCEYQKIDDAGLHLTIEGESHCLPIDHVVICAGQESVNGLMAELEPLNVKAHCIGGADVASELDAKRAIAQGVKLALVL